MVYKPAIPQINDRITKSQKDILQNFQRIKQYWNIDHFDMTRSEVANRGMHKKLTLPEQSSDPTTAANEVAVYSKDSSGNTDIYWRSESDGAVNKLFSKDKVALGGLKLEAYCAFNTTNGDFMQVSVVDIDNPEGRKIDVKSINLSSVTVSGARTTFTINFSPVLSSADYFYTIDYRQTKVDVQFGLIKTRLQIQSKNNVAYASTCTTSKLVLESRILATNGSGLLAADLFCPVIYVEIWTVS